MLTDDDDLHDDVKDDVGQMTSPASGVVRALRDKQVPAFALERREKVVDVTGWERRVVDVAVARTDQVTVAHFRNVNGLERRVVVRLSGGRQDDVDLFRLHGTSRCTTQLIIVAMSPVDSHTYASDSTQYSHTSSEDNTADDDETTT